MNIIEFLEGHFQSQQFIDIVDLDKDFRGVQVATTDNFSTIISQGWTGNWKLQPSNIEPPRIQIASMNDKGNYPRGWCINADIKDIQPVNRTNPIRYKIFIANPVVIDTGNRNVRFNSNPINYKR